MDDVLKARLIGATVLVALAVLLIPELLSGRKPVPAATTEASGGRATRTFTIELAGGPSGSAAVETTHAAPPKGEPAPAASEPAVAPEGTAVTESRPAVSAPVAEPVGAPTPQPAVQSVQAAPPAPATTQPVAESRSPPQGPDAALAPAPAIPARGGWAVQVGAFGSEASARKLVDQLREAGYRAYVAPVSRGGKTLHRVRVGPEPERSEAESLVAGLKVRGLPATVVEND